MLVPIAAVDRWNQTLLAPGSFDSCSGAHSLSEPRPLIIPSYVGRNNIHMP